jgi:alkanesulfonate monooxygenase SsuD/methylene tetrahydromethanopterin reductase-like flavin-dependent oxidoreductase (luciferase family)
MRFGVQLLPQQVSWTDWRDAWLRVDELGFDTNWSYDHVHAPRGDPYAPCFEGWVGMAALAALSRNCWIGIAVSGVRYRNPALLVKMATTLDHVTSGKSILGLGAGWHQNEHEAYGWGFPSAGERVGRLAEALQIAHALWNDGAQPVDFQGRYYQLQGAVCRPAPLGKPHPPILVAGGGPRLLGLVARYADWWDTWAPIEQALERRGLLAAACAQAGRDLSAITWSVSADYLLEPSASRLEERVAEQAASAGRDPRLVRSRMVAGSLDAVGQQVGALAEAGVDHLLLHVPSPYDLTALELFARDIMPSFR